MFFLKWKQTRLASICFSCFLLLTGCEDSKSVQEYINEAQINISNNEYPRAIIALKNAVRLAPENVLTRLELGKLYLKIGDALNAEKEILRAEELGLEVDLIAPLIAEIALIQTNYNEVIVYAEKIKPLLDESAIDLVQFYHLAALFYEKSLSDNLFEVKRLQQSKNSTFAKLGALFKSIQGEDYQSALSLFEKLRSDKGIPLEAYLIAGRLYTLEGEHEKASASYEYYIATRTSDHKAKVLIAESLIEEGRFVEADKFIDQVLVISKNHAFANQLKAVVLFHNKEFEKAKEFADNSLTRGFSSGTNKLILAISHFQLKNYEQSISYFNGIIDNVPSEHPLRKLYILLQLQLGNIDEAATELMTDTDIDELDANLLVTASYELIKSSKAQNAKALLLQLEGTEFDPASSGRVGFMKLMTDDESAEGDLLFASKSQPRNDQFKIALALSYFKNNKKTQALNVALDWIKSAPELPWGYNLAGFFYMQAGQLDNAKDVYRQALRFVPNNKPSLLFESYEQERVGNIGGAEETILTLIEAHPDYIVAYSRLYQIYKLENRDEEFRLFLSRAIQNKPVPELILLMAEIYLENQRYEEVIDLLSNNEMQTDNKIIKLKMLSLAYEGLSDIEKSISSYEELLEFNPDRKVPLKLLALYEQIGMFDKALILINKDLKKFPSDSTLLYLKSLFEILINNIQMAQVTLDRLLKQEENSIYLQYIQGLIYLKSERFDKATKALIPFYKEKPSNKTAMSVYIAYKNLGEKDKNINFLTQHLERFPSAQPIRILLAQLLADTNPEATIEHYNYILKSQPDNWPILNNIAWSYAQVDKLNLAEKSIRKALELNKNSLNLFDTLTYVIQTQNRPEILISEVERVDTKNLLSTDAKLRYAWALIEVGDKDKAISILAQLRGLTQKQAGVKAKLESSI